MARIRANLNSFSTGFISKKVRGNVDFNGYNNGLSECSNFLVQHTGGVFKRGGTEFIAYTKEFNEVKLIPFYFNALESYMCEFGDLAEADDKGNTSYIRFYTKQGILKKLGSDDSIEILHSNFTLDDLYCGSTYQRGQVLTVITLKGIFAITGKTSNEFKISKINYTYPPLTPANYDEDKKITVKKTETNDKYKLTSENPIFYTSDKNEVISLSGMIEDKEQNISFRINKYVSDTEIEVAWEDSLNSVKKQTIGDGVTFVEWRISQFTSDRIAKSNIEYLKVAMYEGRLFLVANNMVWGSSLSRDDILDFMTGTYDDSGILFLLTEMKSDNILWIIGKSKLFIGTEGGLFMSGAATLNDLVVTYSNFRVRLFEKIGSSPLTPISAGNTIFFVDIVGRNVHEIVLSGETGAYQANDLSLIGEDLTHSGIISHTWQQSPIKTYWCAVNDGYLCSLTYLKNNGIMAWAKHEIAGKNVKVESISSLGSRNSDDIWMVVKRQITDDEGKSKIVRSIEYMHPIYDPLAQEEFKQFFVDSGKVKELKHTIENITNGKNYTVKIDSDIRLDKNSEKEKILFASMDVPVKYEQGLRPNPFLAFDINPKNGKYEGEGHALVSKNFHRSGNKYVFDVFDAFDYIKNGEQYIKYRNTSISYGKIDPVIYNNNWVYQKDHQPKQVGIFAKVADIRHMAFGFQTRIYCDTANLNNNDTILLRHTNVVGKPQTSETVNLDYNYNYQKPFRVSERGDDSFVLSPLQGINVDTSFPGQKYSGVGEIYKKVAVISTDLDPFTNGIFSAGEEAKFIVKGKVSNKVGDVYINKVSGMTEINNIKYKIKKSTYDDNDKTSTVTLFDYTKSPDEETYLVPLDAYVFGIYDIDKENNGNMYEYFTDMEGLDHLNGQEVSICSNGNNVAKQIVKAYNVGTNKEFIGIRLEHPSMYCVAGLSMTSKLKTVPFSGGNVLGSSVGVVGQQVHAVFSLYYSLGGKYGTEEDRTYPFPYEAPSTKPFNISKNLFTGIKKLPIVNAKSLYDRCIYIEHSEPLSFNLLAITEELSVTDA